MSADPPHALPQSEMVSNFPFITDQSFKYLDDYTDPDNPVEYGIDLDTQYYLIVRAVPIETPVRIIVYIFKPTDGMIVSVPSHSEFKKDEMAPMAPEDPIYKTTDEHPYYI